tara:strand:- start:3029 stop:3643 length:615 start_codon:yes stop_codon:yes gene_type:complete
MPKTKYISFCKRCYHSWRRRRKQLPKVCPRCKSPYWDKLRKRQSKAITKEVILRLVAEVIRTHDNIIEFSGGLRGIREEGGIYNSVNKILNYQMRHRNDVVGLGAFILNEFAKRHYFNDGNKRTAYAMAKTFMLINRCHLFTTYADSIGFILDVAKDNSEIEFQEIKTWLKSRCKIINKEDMETYLKDVLYNLIIEVRENERTN